MRIQNRRVPDWIANELVSSPEAGMGYQILTVQTKTGAKFKGVLVVDGAEIHRVAGSADVPFSPDEISKFWVTNEKKDLE